ncbi:hypothetical protein BOTBODRAFT_29867 [Botryobasidium botryosum FD-172 SS1]|uniref:Uncharacterized protein n=1 Tax=Botryobasidium botryosum (strain FD-172 SS1) TaxID=930990 RepID=A0A067MSM2_BOTB1|nr:hypothetical protein BOTBODRAFT_29867 [Botryobasidium botryosum FD-172 SS1]
MIIELQHEYYTYFCPRVTTDLPSPPPPVAFTTLASKSPAYPPLHPGQYIYCWLPWSHEATPKRSDILHIRLWTYHLFS